MIYLNHAINCKVICALCYLAVFISPVINFFVHMGTIYLQSLKVLKFEKKFLADIFIKFYFSRNNLRDNLKSRERCIRQKYEPSIRNKYYFHTVLDYFWTQHTLDVILICIVFIWSLVSFNILFSPVYLFPLQKNSSFMESSQSII